jgi:hypothetical protein
MSARAKFIPWCIFLSCGLLLAKDFWQTDYRKWKHSEVVKMLEDSPWSGKVTLTAQQAGRTTTNVGGEMELYYTYTVRLFSALPVRQGYLRMVQLMNQYDEMSKKDREAFDQKFAPALRDFSDQVIVNLDFETNDRQAALEVDRQLKQATTELLRENVYLISDRLGRIPLQQYFPPAPDGTGAKFVFPRIVDGKPVVDKSDKELKFELYMPGTDHKVFKVWKVKDLIVDGKLHY